MLELYIDAAELRRNLAHDAHLEPFIAELGSDNSALSDVVHKSIQLAKNRGYLPHLRDMLVRRFPKRHDSIAGHWPAPEWDPEQTIRPSTSPHSVDDLEAWGLGLNERRLLHQREITELTRVQQEAVERGLLDGADLVVSAPTSAGKTLVGELAVMRWSRDGLVVFLVSHKALARQLYELFSGPRYQLSGTGYLSRVAMFTGDEDQVEGDWIGQKVVIATYEKFYAHVTSTGELPGNIRAIVADELQLLGQESRGPVVELLLARILHEKSRKTLPLQLLVLSATLGNPRSLAEWLVAKLVKIQERDPPLTMEIWTHDQRMVFTHPDEQPDIKVNEAGTLQVGAIVESIVKRGQGPVAVMATQRNYAKQYASEVLALRDGQAPGNRDLVERMEALDAGAGQARLLQELMAKGVGLHYADLNADQRALVEDAFHQERLNVIVATPTLVAGVNLPIRTVVYPYFRRFTSQGEQPISCNEFQNGAGRAGRKGIHAEGTAVCIANDLQDVSMILEKYIHAPPDNVVSRLEQQTVEYRVFQLLATFPSSSGLELARAAALTLWGHERGLQYNESLILDEQTKVETVLRDPRWSIFLSVEAPQRYSLTHAGHAIAASGLEPLPVLQSFESLGIYSNEKAAHGRNHARRVLLAALCVMMSPDALPYSSQTHHRISEILKGNLNRYFVPITPYIEALQRLGLAFALSTIGESEELPVPVRGHIRAMVGPRAWTCGGLQRLLSAVLAVADAHAPHKYATDLLDLELLVEQLEYGGSEDSIGISRLVRARRIPQVGIQRREALARLVGNNWHALSTLPLKDLQAAVTKTAASSVKRSSAVAREELAQRTAESLLLRATRRPEVVGNLRALCIEPALFPVSARAALHEMKWRVESFGDPRVMAGERSDGHPVEIRLIDCNPSGRPATLTDFRAAADAGPAHGVELIFLVRPTITVDVQRLMADKRCSRVITATGLGELWLAVSEFRIAGETAGEILCKFPLIDHRRVWRELRRDAHPL
ncbi:MAG: DEAD/DEAH box helicase [Alphaproteobacteria bacterium]|nr:DEAD/DEAH box helicase [Alphaproteobacteria bacterium]